MQDESHSQYSGIEILSEIDANLVNYSARIVKVLLAKSDLSRSPNPRVLDFGAGAGALTEVLRNESQVSPDCVELDANLRELLISKGFNSVEKLSDLTGYYDFIFSSNVLEHIEDDEEILAELFKLLTHGGYLGIYVPAFELLFTEFDKSVGHFRRYRKAQLKTKLENNGFVVTHAAYSDSLGFFAVGLLKILRFNFGSSKSTTKLMKIYDNFLLPLSSIMDWVGFKFFLGKNVIIVARKQ